uniref:Pentatricopeptide repeat-containing protein n=1 Tax=Kalanchoe fedtschenkoi TaxID=63787 RepID=A0A7N0T693_KALFE
MVTQMAMFSRTRSLLKSLTSHQPIRAITSSRFLAQEPELAAAPDPSPSHSPPPLPPNPATGSPLYQENWRHPTSYPNSLLPNAVVPFGLDSLPGSRLRSMSPTLDERTLMDEFADWTTSGRWKDMKELFKFWIKALDKNGKPNKPGLDLYNYYLRASLMVGESSEELLDLVEQMESYGLSPNTASYNLVLKAMHRAEEYEAAKKLLERMLQTGKESAPNDESYDLVAGMLLKKDHIEDAVKIIDMSLKAGYMLSINVFQECVRSCVNKGRLDTLVSIIEKCKATEQNKALSPSWNLCNYIAEVAMQNDNSKLAFYALEFMAKWMVRGEMARPAVLLSVHEGLTLSALGTAARTFSPTLLDASWQILKHSLRQKKAPNPESYLAKINAYAALGDLQKAFSAMHEFETTYENSNHPAEEEMFSPFTSLYPLVVACSKNGFETLDSVYFQLENLSRADPPYKSVPALNCIILGCANIWDLDRAYQTFEAISGSFGLVPDIHSYNALMCAFGKLKKTLEASNVFEHMVGSGLKPNAKSYSLLVDTHLINLDPKSALSVIDNMVSAGFKPTKEMLKKVRRRCIREMNYECDDQVTALANKFNIRMGTENRRDILFTLDYSTGF